MYKLGPKFYKVTTLYEKNLNKNYYVRNIENFIFPLNFNLLIKS